MFRAVCSSMRFKNEMSLWHEPGKLCRVMKVYDGNSLTLLWTNDEHSPARLVRTNCRLHCMDKRGHTEHACRDALSNAILHELVLVTTTQGFGGLDEYGMPLVVVKVHPKHTSKRAKALVKDYKSVNDWIEHTAM
jgi:hypothetical protein